MVDFREYAYDRMMKVEANSPFSLFEADDEMGEAAQALNKAKRKFSLMWVIRNRNRLLSDAFAAGGDAEYVFMLFEGEPIDKGLWMDHAVNRRVIRVIHQPHERTNIGSFTTVESRGESRHFKMSEDRWDTDSVSPILDHIVKICSEP